jgi:hypothetical protein
MNREQIDDRIFTHYKHGFSPHYKIASLRTSWVGQRDKVKYFRVRAFLTSDRFVACLRYDMVSVKEKEIRIIEETD